MATQERVLARDGDDARGFVTWFVQWDDVNLRLTALRCENNSSEAAWGKCQSVANPSRVREVTIPANTTRTISIPTGASTRFDITVTEKGRIDGVEYWTMWPAPQ